MQRDASYFALACHRKTHMYTRLRNSFQENAQFFRQHQTGTGFPDSGRFQSLWVLAHFLSFYLVIWCTFFTLMPREKSTQTTNILSIWIKSSVKVYIFLNFFFFFQILVDNYWTLGPPIRLSYVYNLCHKHFKTLHQTYSWDLEII